MCVFLSLSLSVFVSKSRSPDDFLSIFIFSHFLILSLFCSFSLSFHQSVLSIYPRPISVSLLPLELSPLSLHRLPSTHPPQLSMPLSLGLLFFFFSSLFPFVSLCLPIILSLCSLPFLSALTSIYSFIDPPTCPSSVRPSIHPCMHASIHLIILPENSMILAMTSTHKVMTKVFFH